MIEFLESINNWVKEHPEYPILAMVALAGFLLGGTLARSTDDNDEDDVIPVLTQAIMEEALGEVLCEHCTNKVMRAYRVAYSDEKYLLMDTTYSFYPTYDLYLANLVGEDERPFHCVSQWDISDKRWYVERVDWYAPCLYANQAMTETL